MGTEFVSETKGGKAVKVHVNTLWSKCSLLLYKKNGELTSKFYSVYQILSEKIDQLLEKYKVTLGQLIPTFTFLKI